MIGPVIPDMMPDAARGSAREKGRLFAECLVLFFIMPPSLYFMRQWLAFKIIPLVLGLSLLAYQLLKRDTNFDLRKIWFTKRPLSQMKAILLIFLPAALAITILVHQFLPQFFFSFPRNRPGLWLIVMLLYPLLAAYPQEIIFRAFFFHRYGPIFPGPKSAVFFNAVSFSLAHAVYFNWVAFGLTFFGGILFAVRYLKSGSLLPAAFEHGLWGNLLFTVGIGWYLYSGSIR